MAKITGRPKRLFIIGFIVAAAVIVIGLATGWNFFKYRFIKHQVSNLLYKHSNGLYTVEYDSLQLNEVAGNLTITQLRLIPDTARYRQLHEDQEPAPALLVEVTIPLLRISGIKTPKAVLNREIEGSKVEINNADIVLYRARSTADETADTVKTPSLQETTLQLLNSLHLVKADTLLVENTSLGLIDFIDHEKRIQGAAISLHLYHILIDSTTVQDTSRFFFAQQADARVERLVVTDKEGFYHYAADRLSFSTATRSVALSNFRIIPLLGETETMREAGEQTDRFDVNCASIVLKNLALPPLMQGVFLADSLMLGKSSIKIYRDLNFPHSPNSMVGKFPYQVLMKLDIPYRIKNVQTADTFIEYKEKNNRSDSSGRVQFFHSFISITNLTNTDAGIAKDNNCVLSFDSRFLDMAALHAVIVMKLKDASGRFTVKGSLGGFDATRLNPLLQPMALTRIEKGQVNQLRFQLNGNDYGSTGKLTLLYQDLKISVLKKQAKDNDWKTKKLASLLANIVAKDANPLKKEPEPREASIDFKRILNKSFFNLIWKSVLQGVKQTVGI